MIWIVGLFIMLQTELMAAGKDYSSIKNLILARNNNGDIV